MSNFSHVAYHPHVHVSPAKPISPEEALTHIQTYLTAAQDAPHLHPDCIFNENGPTLARHTEEGGLTLQLLRRVERGLKGERIVADLPGEDALTNAAMDIDGDEELPDGDDAKLDALLSKQSGLDTDEEAALQNGAMVGKSYNEQMLEQGEDGIIEGEVGDRSNFVADGAQANGNRKRKIGQLGDESAGLSKEEKKRSKREKHKAELREKNLARERAAAGKTVGESNVVEEERIAASNDEDDIEEQQKPLDKSIGPITNGVSGVKQDTTESREEKKAKRKAERAAKKRAQQQVSGEVPNDDDDDDRPDRVERPEERGQVQVVDKFGREANPSEKKKHKWSKKDKKGSSKSQR